MNHDPEIIKLKLPDPIQKPSLTSFTVKKELYINLRRYIDGPHHF